MKKVLIFLVCIMGMLMGNAQDKKKKLEFEVDGKCEMCKMRIEKAALNVPGVKYAVWDIPSHQLSLIVDEQKTDAMQIKTALVKAGHDTKELKASQEAYDNIHPCCKYRDDNTDDSEKH
ncbi:heavy-metal-associated domain-containing protein [Flagellimonas sp. 389]|uniref:heavy-metal-associated domain-containing protein n=1 Tax=Flagellimonas sp. 389 TaxID=2835862 RepID=UPI001BD667E6|nr:heavy-metal-associated domain-containing protein [Flagellimonas sp. 389]MBS9461981.1 heavy-metal-associated domain-containing protein [Flagellimonas sp. 389]